MASKIFSTLLIMCSAFSLFISAGDGAFASESCAKAQALRKERLLFDAGARKKRAALTKEMCSLRLKIADDDVKMAEIQTKLADLKGEVKKPLWDEYDRLGDEQQGIWHEVSTIQNELDGISRERTFKKIALKDEEIKNRYLCIVNEGLGKELSSQIDRTRSSRFDNLVKKRDKAIARLKKSYDSYVLANEPLMEKIKRVETSSDISGDALNALSDDIYKNFDSISDIFDKADDELKGISEELLKIVGTN